MQSLGKPGRDVEVRQDSETTGTNQFLRERVESAFLSSLPLENLTDRLRELPIDPTDVCDSSLNDYFSGFFDHLARALHRTSPQHVLLLCERGIGERAVLIDFIRRGLGGSPPFLKSLEFLMIDARRVTSDQILRWWIAVSSNYRDRPKQYCVWTAWRIFFEHARPGSEERSFAHASRRSPAASSES